MNYYFQEKDSFSLSFVNDVLKEIAEENGVEWKNSFFKWEKKSNDYDFSTFLLKLISLQTKKSFDELFENMKEKFSFFREKIELLKSPNGYVNFRITNKFYESFIKFYFKNGFFPRKNNSKINIEFVSVNPTGYIHLGHLRNAVLGDAIANIYKFMGFRVTKEYYINDRGKQIDDLIESVIFYSKKTEDSEQKKIPKNIAYIGKATEEAAFHILKIFDKEKLSKENQLFRNEVLKFFVTKIKKDLKFFNIHFDKWFSEKKMYLNRKEIERITNFLLKPEFSYRKEGAVFLKTSLFGDEKDRVIIKEDGEFTYFFSDIIYHTNKLLRSDVVINVWGSDHHGYVDRLKSSLKMLGFKNLEKRLNIILIQMVSLMTSEGSKKFSKRFGNAINVEDAKDLIKDENLKFCLLENDYSNSLFINVDSLNKENENSRLYYIQYAYARCNKIISKLSKLNYFSIDFVDKVFIENDFLLNDTKERKILNEIFVFEETVLKSAEQKKPHLLLKYIHSLCSIFHSYYQSTPILEKKSQNTKLSEQRALLVFLTRNIIKKVLKIFSIKSSSLIKKKSLNRN